MLRASRDCLVSPAGHPRRPRRGEHAARRFEQATIRALQASEDAFVEWAMTGKLSAADLFNSIAEERCTPPSAWR